MMKNFFAVFIVFFLFSELTVGQNFSPVARDNYDTADINTPVNVAAPGLLENDTDANDDDDIEIVEFRINNTTFMAGDTANFFQGNITINADGSYVFSPRPGFTGEVNTINYTISDGTSFSTASLFFTVEEVTNLLEFNFLDSCNQGYTSENDYRIIYSTSITNTSNARDYHASSLITNIDLINDIDAIYGNGCVTNVDILSISTSTVTDYINDPYPTQYNEDAINPDFLDGNSSSIFSNDAINNFTLYPRQTISLQFCITVDAFCGGRPNPTVSGSGVDFNNTLNITSSTDTTSASLLLTDFHSTEANVTGALYAPEISPVVNTDATFDYTNTVIISNDGAATATNVNYNMGLGNFLDSGISFDQLRVSQISGPPVNINNNYNGDTDAKLLAPNNSLPAGESIILEIFTLTDPVSFSGSLSYSQFNRSQTQGPLDDPLTNDADPALQRIFSFVAWSDSSGNHLDRYYPATSASNNVPSTAQCSCNTTSIGFTFTAFSSITKQITETVTQPNNILEHQLITYQTTITNRSNAVQLEDLQIIDNLTTTCGGNIVSVTTPVIVNSEATIEPILNTNYDGVNETNIFDGSSGILEFDKSITVQYTVLYSEDCIGTSNTDFLAEDPLDRSVTSSVSININASTDTDGDGIPNGTDIDDDNDTIIDTDEFNGNNPLSDHDGDFIPNYRDTDFSADTNNDGIVDVFDFDNDGVPNHFDLDSDNDGIFDLIEVNNGNTSNDLDGIASTQNVGNNGLHNNVETNDFISATTIIPPANTDNNGNPNFIDIDADDDGIVDNIEAQSSFDYIPISGNTNSLLGTDDTAYPEGITPVDSDNDGIPDYVDINSDNDVRFDILEAWDTNSDGTAETLIANADADNDGLDDAFDNNDSIINPTNNQTPTDFPNIDDSDTPERDWREIMAVVLLINDVTTTESGNLEFTISLVTKNDNSIPVQSASDINILFSTSDTTENTSEFDLAIAPFDYNTLVNSNLTIVADQPTPTGILGTPETAIFEVSTLDDNIYELNELLTLTGEVTSNNTITQQFSGIGTILDNDDKPSITMNDSEEEEGIALNHTLTLSHPSSTPVIINIRTSDDEAISSSDYTAVNENITIEGTIDPNNTNLETSFSVETLNDNTNEPDTERLLILGNITTNNISTADITKTGTILDTDPNPFIFIEDVTVTEGLPLVFSFTLLNPDTEEPILNYLPYEITLSTDNETATNAIDYQGISTTIELPALAPNTTFTITSLDDNLNEETETFILNTQYRTLDRAILPVDLINIGTLKDDDIPNLFSPNNDGASDFFEIAGLEDFPNFKLIIFDRWGSEVYNYSNEGNSTPDWWDGTNNGKPSPEGVYFYNLDFNDGTTLPKKNFIELVR